MLSQSLNAGPDGLQVKHLKESGSTAVVIWLRKVMNAVVELEAYW